MPRKHVGVAIFALKMSCYLTPYDLISPYYGNQNMVPMHWRPATCWTFFFHVTYQALNYLDKLALKLLYMCNNNFNLRNIMGDEILLNFSAKFQCWFEILHVKLQNCRDNLPYNTVPRWRRSFKMLWIKMSQALKDALENLNTWKSTSRRIQTDILSKNSQLKAKFKL